MSLSLPLPLMTSAEYTALRAGILANQWSLYASGCLGFSHVITAADHFLNCWMTRENIVHLRMCDASVQADLPHFRDDGTPTVRKPVEELMMILLRRVVTHIPVTDPRRHLAIDYLCEDIVRDYTYDCLLHGGHAVRIVDNWMFLHNGQIADTIVYLLIEARDVAGLRAFFKHTNLYGLQRLLVLNHHPNGPTYMDRVIEVDWVDGAQVVLDITDVSNTGIHSNRHHGAKWLHASIDRGHLAMAIELLRRGASVIVDYYPAGPVLKRFAGMSLEIFEILAPHVQWDQMNGLDIEKVVVSACTKMQAGCAAVLIDVLTHAVLHRALHEIVDPPENGTLTDSMHMVSNVLMFIGHNDLDVCPPQLDESTQSFFVAQLLSVYNRKGIQLKGRRAAHAWTWMSANGVPFDLFCQFIIAPIAYKNGRRPTFTALAVLMWLAWFLCGFRAIRCRVGVPKLLRIIEHYVRDPKACAETYPKITFIKHRATLTGKRRAAEDNDDAEERNVKSNSM